MRLRERPLVSVRALMPAPAALPSLSDALARRAAIFGPFNFDEAPTALCGLRGARQVPPPLVRKTLLGRADTSDVPSVSVRAPFGGGLKTILSNAGTDVGDGMMVLAQDVSSAVADATLPLAFNQSRQEPVTLTHWLRANQSLIGQVRVAGGLRHALTVALNHGYRLLKAVSLANMALRARSHQPCHHNKLNDLDWVTSSVDDDNS